MPDRRRPRRLVSFHYFHLQVGIRQGFLGGLVVGITNGVAFFAYALALWYGSTRVVAGAYNGG